MFLLIPGPLLGLIFLDAACRVPTDSALQPCVCQSACFDDHRLKYSVAALTEHGEAHTWVYVHCTPSRRQVLCLARVAGKRPPPGQCPSPAQTALLGMLDAKFPEEKGARSPRHPSITVIFGSTSIRFKSKTSSFSPAQEGASIATTVAEEQEPPELLAAVGGRADAKSSLPPAPSSASFSHTVRAWLVDNASGEPRVCLRPLCRIHRR